jgi:NADH-quinone oxidoreductase subunit J
MKFDGLNIALVATMAGAALATVTTARVLRSAILLAATSAVLAALMYRLGAPIAAVFELSVCAGLIPAIFISAIGMTSRVSGDELQTRRRMKRRRLIPLAGLAIMVGLLLAIWRPAMPWNLPHVVDGNTGLVEFPPGPEANAPAEWTRAIDANYVDSSPGEELWNRRRADLLGQVSVMLAGALAVVVLVKELRNEQ